jgi:hypothetical protein
MGVVYVPIKQPIPFEGPYRTQFCQRRMPPEGLACASSTRGPRIRLRIGGFRNNQSRSKARIEPNFVSDECRPRASYPAEGLGHGTSGGQQRVPLAGFPYDRVFFSIFFLSFLGIDSFRSTRKGGMVSLVCE